jgi:hypothetical protein
MRIVEYADAYSYACSIALHSHKRIAYAAMRPHFKTMASIVAASLACITACNQLEHFQWEFLFLYITVYFLFNVWETVSNLETLITVFNLATQF